MEVHCCALSTEPEASPFTHSLGHLRLRICAGISGCLEHSASSSRRTSLSPKPLRLHHSAQPDINVVNPQGVLRFDDERCLVTSETAADMRTPSSSCEAAGQASAEAPTVAPGSVILVRDEEWLVTAVSTLEEFDGSAHSADEDGVPMRRVQRIEAQGLSELVRDTDAVFLDSIDTITVLDPAEARLVNDESPQYRNSRLWLEATLRKTPLPAEDQRIALAGGMLIDAKDYQLTPVRRILDPRNLRPRILLADAVGLGKTIEIGLILAELIKRGRGERILIVTPKHVLEQMQHEMWTKFAIPFVRLDSDGIASIRRTLPATRNPFTYYKRAIISIDTLKSDRYLAHLRRHHWDAVVIDESHNVTNTASLNNRLASVLAQNTDALVLASATPHNGKRESFAELIRLLEPTAIKPTGDVDKADIDRLVVRRHRYSPDVAAEVGTQWAERLDPTIQLVQTSAEEDAIAAELDSVWMYPRTEAGLPTSNPYSGNTKSLFPWTLAKAFLSSPQALMETVDNRLRTIGTVEKTDTDDPRAVEATALQRLRGLAEAAINAVAENRRARRAPAGKYGALLDYLKTIGVSAQGDTRAVVFAERVATLNAVAEDLIIDMKLKPGQVAVLHGGMSDIEQMAIVDDFKRQNSHLRVLVTGDVASEGVNLHAQCHHLIHFDLPWSLIRIEQRNGRIDRYGQTEPPQITTLVLDPQLDTGGDGGSFSGDIRVLQRLIEKENEAHRALGDAAALMGKYSAEAEEELIRRALAKGQDLDTVIEPVEGVANDPFDWLFEDDVDDHGSAVPESADATTIAQPAVPAEESAATGTGLALYSEPVEYLRDALNSIYPEPELPLGRGGVGWEERGDLAFAALTPPDDLQHRLRALPQTYRRERRVDEGMRLATNRRQALQSLDRARNDRNSTSLWPEQHYLGPLHPVLEWADDRSLAAVPQRNAIYAVRADVDEPTIVLHSQLTNLRGQSVSSVYTAVGFPAWPDSSEGLPSAATDIRMLIDELGIGHPRTNSTSVDVEAFQHLVPEAVSAVADYIENFVAPRARDVAQHRVAAWRAQTDTWQQDARQFMQTRALRSTRARVDDAAALIEQMAPDRMITRPLVLAVPLDAPAPMLSKEDS